MFKPRKIEGNIDWLDNDGIKIYTISANNEAVNQSNYLSRLKEVKISRNVDWNKTPAFVIFHDGEIYDYLVLVWWANNNELFTSVSVKINDAWIENANEYSFCLYDLEILWAERNVFIKTIDCKSPSLKQYQFLR